MKKIKLGKIIKDAILPEEDQSAKKDVVIECIGGWGNWHKWICLAISLIKIPIAFHQLVHIFIAPPVQFRCEDNVTDACSANCTGLVYNKDIFTSTTITQWDLVCERGWLADLAQFLVMVGILLGNITFGYLSDRFGRRTPLLIACLLQVLAGVSVALVPWYWLFMLLRFVTAFATGGTMISSFVMVMELVGPSYRTPLGLIYQAPFNIGHLALVGIAYYIRDWHYIQLAVSVPTVLLLGYYFILPESPRWLLAVGKSEKSIEVMEKIARHNKRPTQDIGEKVLKSLEAKTQEQKDSEDRPGNILDLFRTKTMAIRTVCMCFNWISCGLCFFGVAQYMGQIPGNMFLNVALSSFVGLPSIVVLLYSLTRWGRRSTLIGSNILAGVSCVLIILVPLERDMKWLYTVLGCVGMVGMNMAYAIVYIFAGEMYPTKVRNLGVGLCSMMSRIGSMVAPFVTRLVEIHPYLPPLIFGLTPLLATALCFFLPETKGCKLPDTIEEAENIGRKNNNNNNEEEIKK